MKNEQLFNYNQLDRIKAARLDPSRLAAIDNTRWAYAPFAKPLTENQAPSLWPAARTIERASLGNRWETIIGGVCQLFTGDLKSPSQKWQKASELVRLDQLFETVGFVKDSRVLFVSEDSLFAQLTGLDTSQFTRQAGQIQKILERLARRIGVQDIQMVLTSDIEVALRDQVQVLAQAIGAPAFSDLASAPVMLMYTAFWSELLTSLGYLQSPAVLCIEPALHFQEKQRFPTNREQTAYYAFINWLQTEPYAKKGSLNQDFEIAGMTPILSSDASKQRTRLLPFDAVPNTENWASWITKMQATVEQFPFPLQNNLLFGEATNYLMWNDTAVTAMMALANLEQTYKEQKTTLRGTGANNNPELQQQRALKLKAELMGQAQPWLDVLANEFCELLQDLDLTNERSSV